MHFGFRNIMGDGKTAIITGVTGQDGSYLAELLLSKGYHVYGLVRRTSQPTQGRSLINHLLKNERFHLVNGDLTDQSSIDNAVNEIQPDEFYNLGAQSFVPESWRSPTMTADVTGLGALRCLEATSATTRFPHQSGQHSAVFGAHTPIQSEMASAP